MADKLTETVPSCPFCKKEPIYLGGWETYEFGCANQYCRCKPRVTSYDSREDAQSLWVAALSRLNVDEVERAFLAGHADGWRGNQLRRDVQHVDAAYGWELYRINRAALRGSADNG